MDATMLLADAAQVVDGKVCALGLGWEVTRRRSGAATAPSSVVVFVSVPWDLVGVDASWLVELCDADGQRVLAPPGDAALVSLSGSLSTTRDPSTRPGVPLSTPMCVGVPPLPLPVGRFEWRLSINGEVVAVRPFEVVEFPVVP